VNRTGFKGGGNIENDRSAEGGEQIREELTIERRGIWVDQSEQGIGWRMKGIFGN
jgi:hypothetical protein